MIVARRTRIGFPRPRRTSAVSRRPSCSVNRRALTGSATWPPLPIPTRCRIRE